jgi:predicted HicB family RNase H-like nuclease
MNLYASLNAFKGRVAGLPDSIAFDSQDASGIEKVIEAASRRVDQFCNRHFYALTATRVFHGNGKRHIRIPDLLAATTVKLDEAEDGTFEITLAANTDYWIEREGAADVDAKPATVIVLNTNGQRSSFQKYRRLLQIDGRWGYTEDTETLTPTGSVTNATTTTLILTAGDASICVGQTLLYDDIEQMYVTAYDFAGDPTTVTVVRGVNGTPAQGIGSVNPVRRMVYIPDVVEATLEIASSLWKGRETGYVSSTITNPVIGSIDVFPGMPAQAKQLLMPYRIIPV